MSQQEEKTLQPVEIARHIHYFYHPQTNVVVESRNRALGDSLKVLWLNQNPTERDLVLHQLLRAFCSIPHCSTQDTPNWMMFGRELKLPDTFRYNHPQDEVESKQVYVIGIEQRKTQAYRMLQDQQAHIKREEKDEPLRF